nr:PfkB family carbohydrate kinase [Chthonobacter rhizosphaerae]
MLVVFGNAGRDVTFRVGRLPAAGETVNARSTARDLGGKGLNQAIAAARAGATVRLVAPVGTDDVATEIRAFIRAERIADGLVVRPGPSDQSMIVVDDRAENLIVSDSALAEGLPAAEVPDLLDLSSGDGLLMQGNLRAETTRRAAEAGRAAGARVILNPAPFSPAFAALADRIDGVVVNAVEAAQWTGVDDPAGALKALPVPVAVVTRGAAGCLLRTAAGAVLELPAPPVEPVDTTGAGDTFVGAFVAEWLATGDPVRAARLGLAAASEMVTRAGTVSALPTRADFARLRAMLAAG